MAEASDIARGGQIPESLGRDGEDDANEAFGPDHLVGIGGFIDDVAGEADLLDLSHEDAAELDGRADGQATDGFVKVGLVVDLFLGDKAGAEDDHGDHDERGGGHDEQANFEVIRFHRFSSN